MCRFCHSVWNTDHFQGITRLAVWQHHSATSCSRTCSIVIAGKNVPEPCTLTADGMVTAKLQGFFGYIIGSIISKETRFI